VVTGDLQVNGSLTSDSYHALTQILPYMGVKIDATSLCTSSGFQSATITTGFTQVGWPRNLKAVFEFDGTADTIQATFVGLDANGEALSEVQSGELAVDADLTLTWTKAFSQITSMALSCAYTHSSDVTVTYGHLLGVPNGLTAAGDVFKVTKDGVDITSSVTVNAANATVDVGEVTGSASDFTIFCRRS